MWEGGGGTAKCSAVKVINSSVLLHLRPVATGLASKGIDTNTRTCAHTHTLKTLEVGGMGRTLEAKSFIRRNTIKEILRSQCFALHNCAYDSASVFLLVRDQRTVCHRRGNNWPSDRLSDWPLEKGWQIAPSCWHTAEANPAQSYQIILKDANHNNNNNNNRGKSEIHAGWGQGWGGAVSSRHLFVSAPCPSFRAFTQHSVA